MMHLHYLWAKLNKRTCGQFKCDVTWFCFCFNFVRLHARCGYCSIVCFLLFFFGGGIRLKLDVQSQGGGKILDLNGQGQGGLEN